MKLRWSVAVLVWSLSLPLALPSASAAQADGDRLTIRYDIADGVFEGRLASSRGRCESGRTIKVFRKVTRAET